MHNIFRFIARSVKAQLGNVMAHKWKRNSIETAKRKEFMKIYADVFIFVLYG